MSSHKEGLPLTRKAAKKNTTPKDNTYHENLLHENQQKILTSKNCCTCC